LSTLTQIRNEVDQRLQDPVLRARALDRFVLSLTAARVKKINRIVGRAANDFGAGGVWPRFGLKVWRGDIPEYQDLLMKYVILKRKLGLYKKNLNLDLVDSQVVDIVERIKSLNQQVRSIRQRARAMRWEGHFAG